MMPSLNPQHAQAPTGSSRWLPILHWLPRYDRSWQRGDVIAGLTVVALVTLLGLLTFQEVLTGLLLAVIVSLVTLVLRGCTRRRAACWTAAAPARRSASRTCTRG